MERIDPYDWQGDVTAENREQVKRALQERMSTRYLAVSKHELFSAEDLVEGDHIVFAKESVAIILVYGLKTKEYKMVVIE
jgi:fructose-1,6-bisphosphatase/sedoheptulose 1,7-bisphosphatase-like protein